MMEKKPSILIAGGSGLLGTALSKEATRKGYEVTILSREEGPHRIKWDPMLMTIDLSSPVEYDAIINLTGASLSEGRWTDERKKEITDSRILSSATLQAYLANGMLNTNMYIGASGIGIYGDRRNEIITEDSAVTPGNNWIIQLVLDWEKSHFEMNQLGIRTAVVRTGIVLSRKGGALYELLQKAKLGVLAYFGSGQQVWPWIHIHDLIMMMIFIIENPASKGVYIGSSPNPVSNKKLVTTFNEYLKPKRIAAGVPRFVLSIMLGEMHRVLFESCNARPAKILNEGFAFAFPVIEGAAAELMKND